MRGRMRDLFEAHQPESALGMNGHTELSPAGPRNSTAAVTGGLFGATARRGALQRLGRLWKS
jgi:hypothetical protein